MQDCVTASAANAPIIPNKRVSYVLGMVLGVEEFQQDQGHYQWKHALGNLLLHGYGTVCGLHVTAEALPNVGTDAQIRIGVGRAIAPSGKWINVDSDLCARLNEWLQKHKGELSPGLGAGRHTVYVRLCYAECPTDLVPIVGQPCASVDDTRSPSRTLETASAGFSWSPPQQAEEDAIRQFGELLSRVEIVPGILSPDDGQHLLDLVRGLGGPTLGSPPMMSPFPATLNLEEATARQTLRAALRVWVTEVCPRFRPPQEDCILLACVRFSTDANGNLIVNRDINGNLVPGSIQVDDCVRPVLVSERLQQELFGLTPRRSPVTTSNLQNIGTLAASQTLVTGPISTGTAVAGPILLAVDHVDFAPPGPNPGNVALTVLLGPGPNAFRIAATNLSSAQAANNLSVRWWATNAA